jgi:hypothetical protein
MKAYTLRLDDELLEGLKYICLEERKSIKKMLLDLIQEKLTAYSIPKRREEQEGTRVKKILDKIQDKDVIQLIREDRER